MVADGVPYPQVVAGLSYTGEPQTGVTVPEGVTKKTGTISETAVGIYTASFDPASGKCWPTGNTETVTLKWGIAPLLPGVQTGYDPVTEGWKITLTNDLTSPLEIPDSFGALVEGKVELDLNGHSIEIPKAVLPGETNGVSALRIIHDPAGYTGPALNLTITGPGEIKGGDGADGVPAHTAGGLGAAAIEIETGSRVTSNPPTVPATVTVTDGAKGTDYTGGDEPPDLLMTIIDSRDEFVAVAIPYANTNSPAGTAKPTLDSLVRKAELAVGDEAYVYDHVDRHMFKYRLDEAMTWRPVTVIEVSPNGMATSVGPEVCTLEPGYGLWIHRVEQSHRANKIYLWGYAWTVGKITVTLTGGTGSKPGKTLISNPYGAVWNLNDSTRFDWKGKAAVGDQIQVYGGASSIYEWTGEEWKKKTIFSKDMTVPAGFGFWYLRAKGADPVVLEF